jgi:TolA-binding protein
VTRSLPSIVLLAALAAPAVLCAQAGGEKAKAARPQEQTPEEPPEEDAALKEKEYSFNPLQAQKEFTVANFYYKRGSYAAAATRYLEATRWNPVFADAFFRLGETYAKLGQKEKAREAFAKVVEVAPEHKKAAEAKRRAGLAR